MKLEDFDYHLPEELIAQTPAQQRDSCRLMVLNREKNSIEHRHFHDILDYLKPGDCMVLNDSRVIPARLFGRKAVTGAHIEFLLIKRLEGDVWETMVRPGKRLKEGDTVVFDSEHLFQAHILGFQDPDQGTRKVRFEYEGIFMERLEELGSMPLPPYIERPADDADKETYQTVYSRIDGSVAAPTAGLHFTKELLEEIQAMGVQICYVTLHVGLGTFRPVKAEDITDHTMHSEYCMISQETADTINQTKAKGGRVICVGTTSCRTIESWAGGDGTLKESAGWTSIFIYPGYRFKVLDGLVTNFHLPESTLIMLVSALAGRKHVLAAYEEAVREKYRFFSFGDAMFIYE